MKMSFAALVVAASAIFAPVPVAHSNTSGMISEARAAGVIQEAKANGVIKEAQAVDVKAAGLGKDGIGSFNSGLPMQGGFDRERETSSWLTPKGTTPSISWIVALGFLGLIIMRRTRQSMM
jgi:hypothetical protein